jgi:hypothetical protein
MEDDDHEFRLIKTKAARHRTNAMAAGWPQDLDGGEVNIAAIAAIV